MVQKLVFTLRDMNHSQAVSVNCTKCIEDLNNENRRIGDNWVELDKLLYNLHKATIADWLLFNFQLCKNPDAQGEHSNRPVRTATVNCFALLPDPTSCLPQTTAYS